MSNKWLITFRSITLAQRGERILRRGNLPCQLQRTPKALTERGCGYCLRLQAVDAPIAVELFNKEQVPYEKLYAQGEDGSTRELVL